MIVLAVLGWFAKNAYREITTLLKEMIVELRRISSESIQHDERIKTLERQGNDHENRIRDLEKQA